MPLPSLQIVQVPSQNLSQRQSLSQQQVLSQQQLMGVKLLAMPELALRAEIRQKLQQNVMLSEVPLEQAVLESQLEPPPPQENPWDGDGKEYWEEMMVRSVESPAPQREERMERLSGGAEGAENESWDRDFPYEERGEFRNPDEEEWRQHRMESLTREPSYAEKLKKACAECLWGVPEKLLELCRGLCDAISPQGILEGTEEELCRSLDTTPALLRKAIRLFQERMEPAGIGGRTAGECLMLQLARLGRKESREGQVLALLDQGRSPREIGEILSCSEEEVRESMEWLAGHLKRNPLEEYGESARYVVPDVVLRIGKDGRFFFESCRRSQLALDGEHLLMLEHGAVPRGRGKTAPLDKETEKYLRDKLQEANDFIFGVERREETILLVARKILEKQYDYFESRGDERRLKPLTQESLARELKIAGSTISRAVNEKYMETPWGVLEFSRFFPSGGVSMKVRDASGQEVETNVTRQYVTEKIQEIVQGENPGKPLSDDKIAELLKERGILVARRTVRKYRDEAGIPSSSERRSRS
ncbi:MAG: hypothetical protein ACI4SG_08435 [Oligosphaeraceae bacterium]